MKVSSLIATIIAVFIIYSIVLAQPVGEVITIGTTRFDNQHIGSLGRAITIGNNNSTHFFWTGLINPEKVLYNRYLQGSGLSWTGGIEISSTPTNRYGNIEVSTGGTIILCYESTVLNQRVITAAAETAAGSGQFIEFHIPSSEPKNNPLLAVDSRRYFHILAFSDRVNYKMALYYNRSVNAGLAWLPEWVFIDSVRVLGAAIAASENGKVSIAWAHNNSETFENPLVKLNNDLYWVESADGINWDFSNPVNLTDFENGYHPESDSLRLYDNISIAYGSLNYIHFVYTLAGYWEESGHLQTCAGSKLYHYCNNTGYSFITGELSTGKYPANERRIFDNPSISYNPTGQSLYTVWTQYDNEADTSSTGYLNGEIWGSYSLNQSGNWSQPVNMTRTSSPGAIPGTCLNECQASLSKIADDTLRMIYFLDYDQENYGIFSTDVKYLKISGQEFQSLNDVENQTADLLPEAMTISAWPNPFNSSANLTINITESGDFKIALYNIDGREMENLRLGFLEAGSYDFKIDGRNYAAGVYFVRVERGKESSTQKIVLLK